MTKKQQQLRLRIFAGPNGSGKSTIIQEIRSFKVNGIPVDFGIYVNADDIAQRLRTNKFSFRRYKITTTIEEIIALAKASGLLQKSTTEHDLKAMLLLQNYSLKINDLRLVEQVAQILADVIRRKLLNARKKFSFETVFSHESKLDFMSEAIENGYKVYLYFVSTESPDINVFRVKKVRIKEGGHNVPEDKIRSRYIRSLELLHAASQLTYQSFFFDNSGDAFELFAHFKNSNGKKNWDEIDESKVPEWFRKYYSQKIG